MALFRRGYLPIGRWRGVPVLLHWSTPFGALLFGGFRFAPAFWLGFVGLVLLHELGHAWFVLRARARVLQVEAHALGGLCTWEGRVSPVQRSLIAWGGVVAQAAVLVGAQIFLAVHGRPETRAGAELVYLATWTNVFMIALNLIPIAPLDGAEAWRLFPRWKQQRETRAAVERDAALRAARAASRSKLSAADALEDAALEEPPPEIASLVDEVLQKAKTPPKPGGSSHSP